MNANQKKGLSIKGIDFRSIVMPALLLILIIFFTINCPGTFLTWYNFKNMINQTGYILVAAVGLTFVIIGGGVDLAIGYEMSLSGVIVGILITVHHWSMWPAILVGIVAGAVMGLINGIVVVKLKVFPLIITLSTSFIWQGFSYILSNSKTFIGFSDAFKFIGQGDVGPIPVSLIIAAIICGISYFILNRTYFGRHIYALGGNEEAAKLAGVNTNKIRYILYTLCGATAAISAVMLTARAASSSPSLGPGTEFTCLSGCILGGITLDGGEGNISGMVIGSLIITVLSNGMQLMYLGTYPQYVVKGIVLIAAMGFDVYQKKHRKVA